MASANAFADIMAPSASASSSKRRREQFDVFINHRGPDTKQTLAASIHHSLKLMGLRVFLDEPELDLGDSIPSEIQEAVTSSFLHIAILSPRYAESVWCLEELLLMLKSGKTIIPVFYSVDPSKIHWICQGKGPYAEAFKELEGKNRYRPDKIENWKSALQTVSYLKGPIVRSEDDKEVLDKEVLKIIANYVLEHSKKIPFVMPEYPVGLDNTLKEFERSVLESSENVTIVGITGMGGCGKTTLAKGYYNKMIRSLYRCCFVSDVRDVPTKKLYKKQEKIFQDLGGSKDISFDSVEEGKAILVEYLRFVRVFIILDNVDHQDQLESLLPTKNRLAKGSVILITSRDHGLLISWGIPLNCIYQMKNLSPNHAMELFCWHAFQQLSPIDGFECLVKKYTIVCKGLPLYIKVLGALVHAKSKEFWNGQLEKFSESLHKDIKTILMVSFDALDEREKEIFLDISCFFTGTRKDLAMTVWEESGSSAAGSLGTLIDKCLVEVDIDKCLRMHDLLRDLGKNISMTCSPYRLWSPQQITHIENEGKESMPIRGIKVQTDEFYEELMEFVKESGRGIKRMRGLKILDVENNYFTRELAPLSEDLVSLRWANFPHTALPSWVPSKKLRILELREADKLEELWSGNSNLPLQLRELNIINARNFQRFPRSIDFLKHLKNISFDGKGAPIEGLPNEFCSLQSLERLKLVGCHILKSLPSKFGDLTNLQLLDIRQCRKLMITSEALVGLTSLEHLYFVDCPMLTEFVIQSGCSSSLCSLNFLVLTRCGVARISISPECCPTLRWLSLCSNHDLVEINNLPISVKILEVDGSSKLQRISLNRGLDNLEYLRVDDCEEVCKIEGLENCSSLQELKFKTDGEVPVIESLKDMGSLRGVRFTAACHISAFEPFIQSLNREKWPSRLQICGRAEPGVEATVETCMTYRRLFPDLALVDSFSRQKTYMTDKDDMTHEDICWEYVFSEERSANAAVMICLVINSHGDYLNLRTSFEKMGPLYCAYFTVHPTSEKMGQNVYIGVFLPSPLEGQKVSLSLHRVDSHLQDDLVKMGILAMGKENRVLDTFYQLLQLLGKAGNISAD